MDWTAYVRRTIGDDKQIEVKRRTGIDQTTISRWLHGQTTAVTPKSVTAFAHGYGLPVLEAFVEAGLLSPDDVKVRPMTRPALRRLSDDVLLDELARRTKLAKQSAS